MLKLKTFKLRAFFVIYHFISNAHFMDNCTRLTHFKIVVYEEIEA